IPYEGDPDAFLAQENVGLLDSTGTGFFRYSYGHIITDASLPGNNYVGTKNVTAGYMMAELPITERFRVIAGARLESSLLETESEAFEFIPILSEDGEPILDENGEALQDSTIDGGRIDELDLLPSLNVVYALSDNMNVRAAATRTLARPTFREFSTATSFDFAGGFLLLGNPDLQRTLINNYDLRWEWFTRPGEILAVSAFYKYLQDPIELAIVGGTNGQAQYQNVPTAEVQGLEIEMRSRLDRIAAPLANFSVGLNLTLTSSNVDIPERELLARQVSRCTTEELDGGTCDVDTQRELQGQSPYIVNADLGYQNFESGTTASLLFNVFGSRLSGVGFAGTPDIFEQPSPQLDFTFSQGLFDNTIRVKLGVKNLLNEDYDESYEFEGETFAFSRYNLGRSYSFGVTYSL
ncbi:MAG: TonB-dependent receptor, partial [Bacteroidota bacterium]